MDALNILVLVLNIGTVKVELFEDIAPLHVAQIKTLVEKSAYDGVVFHRVIDGFMAQVGDVQYGNVNSFDADRVGTGGSSLPNIKAEFNDRPHTEGTVSMARANHPDSANSQFFICLEDARFLDRNYTVFGQVIEGMDIVKKIKKGHPQSGRVETPDYIERAYLESK